MSTYDVIVVGGGPAGATVAYELATSGINVLILEKERFPRYKPCGGGLSLKIDRVLKFSIKEVIETTVMGVHFSCQGKNGRSILSDRPVAYMVMRDKFDSLLIIRFSPDIRGVKGRGSIYGWNPGQRYLCH
ncbi:MAG: FAD-dependent oxidoreductase [Nitrospirae bacterium]|nr:FAD-dependent oxidoreductase [Nitrospirota bacterium]